MARIFLALLLCVSSTTMLKAQIPGPGVDPNATIFYDFESGTTTGWNTSNAGRGERQSVEFAQAENGDPVRFGNRALRLNFDMTDAQTSQTLGCFYSPSNCFSVPASPGTKRLGMWIYATPEAENYWLRFNLTTTNFTGWDARINWTGWKYIELEIPANTAFGPHATQFIRLMSTNSGTLPNGPMTKGYLVIDNVRVSQAAEDRTPPSIGTIMGNGSSISGQKLTTSRIGISATLSDGSTATASGINFSKVRVMMDGYTFKAGDAGFSVTETTANAGEVELESVSLSNGAHSVEVYVEDNFGHVTTKTASFEVDATDGKTTTVTLKSAAEAHVGNSFEMEINTNKSKDIKEMEIVIELNNVGSVDGTGGVVFAESAQESTYNFNPRNGHLTINFKNDITADETEKLATIKVSISKNSTEGDVLKVFPVYAKATYADNSLSLFKLFNSFSRNVLATYNFVITKRMVGAPGEVFVTDLKGNPQSGVTVNVLNAATMTPITSAVTGANGIASGMNFTNIAQGIYVFAEKDGKYSFTKLTRTLSIPSGVTNDPKFIRSGVAPDPTSSKTITWISNPQTSAEQTIMKIAKKSDGEDSFKEVTGTAKMLEYDATASNGIVKGNSVTVTDLDPGTTYIYQVGDGTKWSSTREFTTTTVTDKFSFCAFGDLQASSTAIMSRFIAAAKTFETDTNPFFSLNVGDINDTDDRWDYSSYFGYLFDQVPCFANIDMTATYGNHEYMGTNDADNIKFLNGHPSPEPSSKYNAELAGNGSYAVEYGNMLVIGLDWEHKFGASTYAAVQQEQAKWMKEVLSKTDKKWKIVTLHYPIFPSASTPGSQNTFGPLFDEYNVQVVFCGHGHTFERVQVKEGGITSGSDRRTFKPVPGNGTLHWQIGDMTGTGNNGRWIHCAVDGGKMTVTVRDANNNVVNNECFTLYASEDDTSIENIFAPNLKIYPNPFADELRITNAENCTLRIMDVVGKQIYAQKITDANETIRLGKLSAGVYFFRLGKDGQTRTVKVLKK